MTTTRVNVVDFDFESDPIAVDAPGLGQLHSVLYMMVPRWATAAEIDRRANRLRDEWRVFADLVVCRVHPSEYDSVIGSAAMADDLVARFPNAPVAVLTWRDHFHMQYLSGAPALAEDETRALLRTLRHAELRALVDRAGVILPHGDGFHYQGPNGLHYESFVRVGTAVQAVDGLDGVSFWLLPWLERSPVIVLDSWTILSLGLGAARYAAETQEALALGKAVPEGDASGTVAQSPDRLAVRGVEALRAYGEPRERLKQRLAAIRRRFPETQTPPPILLVVSVSSTGETAAALAATCAEAGFPDVSAVALYGAEPDGGIASAPVDEETHGFCSLPEIAAHYPPNQCPHCEQRSVAVPIMRDTYLLDLAAASNEVAITIADIEPAATFLRDYAGTGALSVHRDQHDSRRHHMIHVDVRPLLGTGVFKRKLAEALDDEIAGIDLILVPGHDAAQRLADEICLLRPETARLNADPEQLLELGSAERAILEASRKVLIVDDVVVTGTRLRQYRNMLHRQGAALTSGFQLHFLAGVARPENLTALRGVLEYTHDAANFHFVELLPLPNWGYDECPWCQELELLLRFGSRVPDSELLSARFRALRGVGEGLSADLFIPWKVEGRDPWKLGPGSKFPAQSEPEVFAAVASAIQVLRANKALNEKLTLPVAKVLRGDATFTGRFYDTVITASILRAARRHDLRNTMVDPDLEAMTRTRLCDPPEVGLHGELLLALKRGQLPGGSGLAQATHVFDDDEADAGVRAFFRAGLLS